MPLRHRHGYAADLHRGLPASDLKPTQEFLTHHLRGQVRTAIQPLSTGFELAGNLRGVMTLVPLVHLPVSLAGPGPSDSSDPSRRCRGCLPSSPASPGLDCPQLHYATATAQRWRSFTSTRSHGASWRSKSPSQKPGTARSSASAGRSLMLTMSGIFPLLRAARDRGTRLARPCRNASLSSVRSSPFACKYNVW